MTTAYFERFSDFPWFLINKRYDTEQPWQSKNKTIRVSPWIKAFLWPCNYCFKWISYYISRCFCIGTTGYCSRRACPVFSIALASPTSNHFPVLWTSCRNQPVESRVHIPRIISAAMRAFSSLFVSKYSDFLDLMMSLNWTFPAWLLIRLPQP